VTTKLARLQAIVALRDQERTRLASAQRMQQWVLEAEALLAGTALRPEERTPERIGAQFDRWCADLLVQGQAPEVAAVEQRAVAHFGAVTARLRPHLLECYVVAGLPRTNNEMEGFIRQVKSRYRRISGRKNWNRYLLRYGRRIVYYEPSGRAGQEATSNSPPLGPVDRAAWRAARAAQHVRQMEQLTQYRFRHKQAECLAALEARWATSAGTRVLP
jgi:hypothetical protein